MTLVPKPVSLSVGISATVTREYNSVFFFFLLLFLLYSSKMRIKNNYMCFFKKMKRKCQRKKKWTNNPQPPILFFWVVFIEEFEWGEGFGMLTWSGTREAGEGACRSNRLWRECDGRFGEGCKGAKVSMVKGRKSGDKGWSLIDHASGGMVPSGDKKQVLRGCGPDDDVN